MAALAALFIQRQPMFGSHQEVGICFSIALVVAGLALRSWGGGSAGQHTRSGQIEAPQLTTGGPYAYVRNPIYLGSIVLGLGMIGLVSDPRLLVLYVLTFIILYTIIVPAEERFLQKAFGEHYERYRRAVPQMIPRLRPWQERTERPFDWRVLRGEACIAGILVVIYQTLRLAEHLRS